MLQPNKKGRLIYSASFNDFLNTTNKVKYDLGFTGIVKKTETYHKKGSNAAITVIDNYTYDHVNRLTKHTQTIGGHTELIAKNIYDELGNLTQKLVGNTGSNSLQTIDYEYNVRGWLEEINDVDNISNDLFTFELSYNNTELSGSVPLYNGNISEAIWLTANDKLANSNNTSRAYSYNYDGLNRLVDADYFQNEAKPYITEYDLKTTYDKNGNLTELSRGRSYGTIDGLEYSYNYNRLIEVVDNGYSGSKAEGFVDDGIAGNDYSYDDNGNLTSDANKGITSIMYNHLNMPTEIKFNGSNSQKINYIYNANGIKQRKITNDNGNIATTDYAGNFVYENGSLKLFFQPEGYIEPNGNGGFDYVYNYKDHLGNIRLSYSDIDSNSSIDPATEILDEKNYYPFGLQHKGYNNVVIGSENNYNTFQGQEFTKDLGLNIHEWKYRISDPAIGRFWQIDPLAQDYAYQSPYNFSENRVIDGVELEGAERLSVHTPGWIFSSQSSLRNEHPTEAQMNASTAGVIARHPIATSNVGSVERGGTNISSISGRIARHVAENGNMTIGEGTQRNAFRHAVWSGAITSRYGVGVAQRIGNAHEGIPMGAQGNAHVDFDQPAPDNLGGVDSVVDFLNNEIGRDIGSQLGEGATEWDVAIKVLDVQLNEGLWTATTDKDGNITISRTKITQEQYNMAFKILQTLNRNGMNNADRKDLEETP